MTEAAKPAPQKIEWHRFAWPAAFVIVATMGFALLRDPRPEPTTSEVRVQGGNTVVKSLHDLARLETTSLHVEKVIDVRDHQKRLYGLLETEDSLLFIASGEVVIGVDLARLRDEDARFDEATKTATITLPEPEVLSTRFDEMHSYVHSRNTGVLAERNEQLEAIARRDATTAFQAAGRQKDVTARAKEQAERQIRSLATAWGAKNVIVTWRPLVAQENAATAPVIPSGR
jgi:hypothetical protein